MAGNKRSGRDVIFPYSEEQLEGKFTQYLEDLKNGEFARASVPHFCFYIGITEDVLRGFVRDYSEKPESAYYRRALQCKGYLQFFRGQLFSSSDWSGQLSSRAQMLLEQDFGDGIVYKAKDKTPPKTEMLIRFAEGDARAELAGK